MDEVADVPYEGVVSWLLCRRMLPEDYQQRLKGMRGYIRDALQQPPDTSEAAAFIADKEDSSFGYYEVDKLVQILAKEGAGEGLFSKAFGSAAYRQWRRLQRTFQQQNLHVADVSRALCSAANALVPSHQKNLQQKQRLVSECIAKQQQLQQTGAAAQESYHQLCSKYGLDAAEAADPLLLQQQLHVYVHRNLPTRLQQAELLLQKPGAELLAFYRSFVRYSTGEALEETSKKERQSLPLPLLELLSVKGNMSLKEAAAAADIPLLQQQVQRQQQQQEAAAAQIEIQQQGAEGEPLETAGNGAAGESICWVVEEGVEDSSSNSSSNSSSDNSSITESLLGNDAVRRQLLLELTELRAFLYSRVSESAAAANGKKQQQQQQQQWQQNVLPQELQRTEGTLLDWQQSVKELQELLGGVETLQLLQLLQNDRAFNRVLSQLMAARALVQKPLSAAKQQHMRQASLESEVAEAAAALEKQRLELQQLLRLLQEVLAGAAGRKVRITGLPRDRLA